MLPKVFSLQKITKITNIIFQTTLSPLHIKKIKKYYLLVLTSTFISSKNLNMNWNFKIKKERIFSFEFLEFSFIFRFNFQKVVSILCCSFLNIFFSMVCLHWTKKKTISCQVKFIFKFFLKISLFYGGIYSTSATVVDLKVTIPLWLQESWISRTVVQVIIHRHGLACMF